MAYAQKTILVNHRSGFSNDFGKAAQYTKYLAKFSKLYLVHTNICLRLKLAEPSKLLVWAKFEFDRRKRIKRCSVS